MTISAPYETGSSSGAIDEASDIKMADFMMDGAYFRAFNAVFGTVRQILRHFGDGRSV